MNKDIFQQQPILENEFVKIQPLKDVDFEVLYAVTTKLGCSLSFTNIRNKYFFWGVSSITN